jgi:hypothetical protein
MTSSDVQGHGDGTLVDLLDRLLAGGIVVTGDVTLSVADVDLVRIRLLAVLSSVPTLMPSEMALEP